MTDKFDLGAALRGEPFQFRDPTYGKMLGQITLSPSGDKIAFWAELRGLGETICVRPRSGLVADSPKRYDLDEEEQRMDLVMSPKPKRELWVRPYCYPEEPAHTIVTGDAENDQRFLKETPGGSPKLCWSGPPVRVWREE